MSNSTRMLRRILPSLSLFLALLAALWPTPLPVHALSDPAEIPTLPAFSQTVQNGQKNTIRGIYVDEVLALPVVQQPQSNPGFVSSKDNIVTQFRMASKYGNIGLLAHNHLAGRFFSYLTIGQEIELVYGDGRVETFIVTEVLAYQALSPNSPYSSFKNLENGTTLNATQMFKRVYFGDRHVTLQTCIKANGQASWGRLFIIAYPKEDIASSSTLQLDQ